MSAQPPRKRDVYATAVRWIARLLSVGLLVLFAVFIIGEGPPPLSRMTLLWGMIVVGLCLAWYSDLLGAVVILVSTLAFYTLNYSESGRFPGGWVFPLLYLTGVLLLYSYYLRRNPIHSVQ